MAFPPFLEWNTRAFSLILRYKKLIPHIFNTVLGYVYPMQQKISWSHLTKSKAEINDNGKQKIGRDIS